MNDEIRTENFPTLTKSYDIKLGAYTEFTSPIAANVAFIHVMHEHGYWRGHGRTWLKPGMAVVIQP